ncbi:MAG TPA: 2-dehydropantoate 2-reductase [Puia sp.]|jgi:2-dehydropantoate 2-reductase|nr:2-dehydropantoate 2-reductase [Puia sp.]
MPSITIIGPGAIGGTVAASLARDPANEITICARTPFSQLTVDTPQGRLVTTPDLFTSPEQVKAADWVLIATKTYDVAGTIAWLPRLIGPHTRVAILQNGVEHVERFAPFVNPDSLVPVVIDLPAERSGPGNIRQRGAGQLVVPDGANGQEFVELFVHTGLVATATTDFRSRAWSKLALNCTGAVSAILLRSINIHQHEEIADVYRSLIRECILVGRAEGATLAESLEEDILTICRQVSANAVNSIHADRLAGRPLEIDARNGAVVRIGHKHGLDTPVNQLMVALLKAGS